MMFRAFSASAFGLRGGIPMEAAQTNVYHAPACASRTGITRSIQIHTTYIQPIHLVRSVGRRCLLQRSGIPLDAQRSGNRGQICETRSDSAPLDTRLRAIPKAPRSTFAAFSQLYGDVSLACSAVCAIQDHKLRPVAGRKQETYTMWFDP